MSTLNAVIVLGVLFWCNYRIGGLGWPEAYGSCHMTRSVI